MRTVVVSDLHLGVRRGSDLVRHAHVRARLVEALAGADRVVFLGDLVELRECTLAEGVAAAEPLFGDLGEVLEPGAEVVIVPGNHDHALAGALLDDLGGGDGLVELEHRRRVDGGDPLEPLAARLGGVRLEVAYPGVWLGDGVYALHGHHMDLHSTVPTFECLALAGVARANGGPPGPGSRPADYERLLGPVFRAAAAAGRAATGVGSGANLSAGVWARLAGNAGAPKAGHPEGGSAGGGLGPELAALGVRALAGAVSPAVAAVNRAGLGPFDADFSGAALRRSGLRSLAEVVRRLEIDAEHVLFGHTHRAGPLARDGAAEWEAGGGTHLHNTGCWVYEPVFVTGQPGQSPYWPGKTTVVEPGRPPRLEPVLDDVDHATLLGR